MNIQLHDFLPKNTLHFSSSNHTDIGNKYGKCIMNIPPVSKPSNTRGGISLTQANDLLLYADTLSNAGVCTIKGRNILKDYLDLLRGYCKGAEITIQQGIIQQAEIVSGCQTMIIKNLAENSIGFLHTEENFDDIKLRTIYKYIEANVSWNPGNELPNQIESAYDYKMVEARVGDMSYSFFGYPDLCFGGPAMGCNLTTNTFMCVDSLYSKTKNSTKGLWANAIATMFFLLGDCTAIRELSKALTHAGIYILNGYAFHIVDARTSELTSFEFGGDDIVEVKPDRHGAVEYVGQPNYPRSSQLKKIDILHEIFCAKKSTNIWHAQSLLEMKNRIQCMKQFSTDSNLQINEHIHEILQQTMHSDIRTLEQDFYNKNLESVTGFITPYLAGYATGYVSPYTAEIQFSKLFPTKKNKTPHKFWYSREESKNLHAIHLYDEAQAYCS